MLESHFTKTARVDRLTTVLDEEDEPTAKKDYQTHIASLACHLQPLDPTITQDIPGGFGKNFLMLSAAADIDEGDRVIIEGDEYRVIGTEQLTFNGKSHQETIIRIFQS
jgi:hypothetical protein